MNEFKDDLQVNKYQLDVEWEKQAHLYAIWSEKYAEACHEKDKIKQRLDIAKAKKDKDIRINYENYGFIKPPTEAAINTAISRELDIQKIETELIQATHFVNMYFIAKQAFEHKKKALDGLTNLYCYNYYTNDPKIRKEKKEITKVAEKTHERITEALNEKE